MKDLWRKVAKGWALGEDEYQVGFCPKLEAIRDNSAERAAPDLIQELHSKRLHPHRHQQEHQLHGLAKGSHQQWGTKGLPGLSQGKGSTPTPSNEGSQRQTCYQLILSLVCQNMPYPFFPSRTTLNRLLNIPNAHNMHDKVSTSSSHWEHQEKESM